MINVGGRVLFTVMRHGLFCTPGMKTQLICVKFAVTRIDWCFSKFNQNLTNTDLFTIDSLKRKSL